MKATTEGVVRAPSAFSMTLAAYAQKGCGVRGVRLVWTVFFFSGKFKLMPRSAGCSKILYKSREVGIRPRKFLAFFQASK